MNPLWPAATLEDENGRERNST